VAKRGIWPLTEEAMLGLAVFAKAQISPTHLKKIVKSQNITSWRAEDLFASYAQLDNVKGLNQLSKFISDNVDNVNGIDGAIFEAQVAAAIRSGADLAEAGKLQRVSADGLPNLNKIDTGTEFWGIQIKHKSGPGNFGLSDLNQGSVEANIAYLQALKEQALSNGLKPALITNKPLTDEFLDQLDEMGIESDFVLP
jgi:hypothetical protein